MPADLRATIQMLHNELERVNKAIAALERLMGSRAVPSGQRTTQTEGAERQTEAADSGE